MLKNLNKLIEYKDIPNSRKFKECLYEYYETHNFTDMCLLALSQKLDIPFEKLKDYLDDYIRRYKLMSKKEFIEYVEEKRRSIINENSNPDAAKNRRTSDTKIKQCFENIIKCDNVSKIYDIIKESGYAFSSLEHNFVLYGDFFTIKEKEKYYKNMKEYVSYHKKHIRELQEQKKIERLEKRLDELCELLDDYISQGEEVSLKSYLSEKDISITLFYKYLDIIKKHDLKKYNQYKKFEEIKQKNKSKNLVKAAKEVGNHLEEGYEENGEHRDFDIIDYFLITKYKLYEIYTSGSRVLSKNQLTLLKKFKINNETADEVNRADKVAIRDEKRIVGVQFDKNNKPIPNTGRIITEEEKENLIKYLTENKIPINRFTYRALMKRYLKGYIIFEEEKKLTKKNK